MSEVEIDLTKVDYEMESDLQRLRFTIGHTSLTLEGPEEEANLGMLLVDNLRQLVINALRAEGVIPEEEYDDDDEPSADSEGWAAAEAAGA